MRERAGAVGRRDRQDRDRGMGMVEVVMSMVLLGVVTMAFLPLVVRSVQAAASATTLTTAMRLVSQQVEIARATPLTACPTTGPEPLGVLVRSMTDARGVELQTWAKYTGPCTAPGTVRYQVSVTRASAPATPVTSAMTLLPVPPW